MNYDLTVIPAAFIAGVLSGHVIVTWIKREIACVQARIEAKSLAAVKKAEEEAAFLCSAMKEESAAVHGKLDNLLSREKVQVFQRSK